MIQQPEIHHKNWGSEHWIVNNEKYCGKILHFEKGKRCSFHYHRLKTESFFLQSGKILLTYSYEDDIVKAEKVILMPGDVFHIPIGLRHQMTGIEESDLFEFSTQHFESDSYRILKGD